MSDPTTTTTTTTEAASPNAVAATTTTAIKPGHKTTEFVFGILAAVLTGLYATGVIPTQGPWATVCAIAAITLTALGYTVSRTIVKKAATLALVLFAFGSTAASTGCDGARARGAAGVNAAIQCGKDEIRSAAAEFVPALLANVRNALGADGKIDRPTFREFAAPLKSAAGRCALDTALAMIANPPPPDPNAPQSEPLTVDKADLAAAYAEVRADAWGGAEVRSQ